MFLGQFQHNLDDKGRLMIPARYRDLLAAGAFITQGFDKCLMVITDAYFKEVYERINTMNMADSTARLLRRLMEKPGKVYSRSQLLDASYEDHRVVSDRTVDSHIRNLRRKFSELGHDPIESVYGVGFRFEPTRER